MLGVLLATLIVTVLAPILFVQHIQGLGEPLIPANLDVVGNTVKPTCGTREAIASLNRYLHPRTIHVITTTPAGCEIISGWASNVRCHLEDDVIPGVSAASVGGYLEARHGAKAREEFSGRSLSGWYLQQFLKLGAARYLPGLSEYFVVWDMDMILLRAPRLFFRPPRKHGAPEFYQNIVHIGGSKSEGYDYAYRQLFDRGLEYAPDGSSFVTHWIVVYKPYMEQFLDAVAASGNATETTAPAGAPWVWRILDAADPSNLHLGFSEYASYVSWVRQHYPHSQRLMRRRSWLRHPIGGQRAVAALARLHPQRLCCPWRPQMWLMQVLGYGYTGFEIGHIPACGFTDPKHEVSYGV